MNKKVAISAAILVLILIGIITFQYTATYRPMPEALEAMNPDEDIFIVEEDDYIGFALKKANTDTDTALIIYPGGMVDPRAYAPTAKAFAERGIRTFVAKMPLNLAVFNYDTADKIIDRHTEKHWYIAGHSLGGVMAAKYADNNPDKIDGLILWASYPMKSTDLSDSNMPVMSVYATNDGHVMPGKISDTKHLLPPSVVWISIKGGNHSQFGWYGFQKGDEAADITREEQQQEIVEATMEFISNTYE